MPHTCNTAVNAILYPTFYPGTIKTLLEELEDISGSEWFKLGHWLGVKDSTLRDIEANHK